MYNTLGSDRPPCLQAKQGSFSSPKAPDTATQGHVKISQEITYKVQVEVTDPNGKGRQATLKGGGICL